MKAAVTYIRVSSENQEDGYSLDAQEKLLKDYAKQRGITIVKEYRAVESAKDAGRPVFNEMVEYLKKHKEIPCALIEKTDRSTRNSPDLVQIEELADRHDKEIHLVKESLVISKDGSPSDRFIFNIMVAVAKNTALTISAEAKKGMREKANQGVPPSQAPLGYLIQDRTWIFDPVAAPMMIKIFEMTADGKSLSDCVRLAKNYGIKTSRTSLHSRIHNPVYKGLFMFHGKWHQTTFPALVSVELWDKANEKILSRAGKGRTEKRKHVFLYNGMMKCQKCGRHLSGYYAKSKVYYRCAPCNVNISEQIITDYAISEIIEPLSDDEMNAQLRDGLKHVHEMKMSEKQTERKGLEKEYAKLTEMKDKNYDAYLAGKIAEDLFNDKDKDLQSRLREIKCRLTICEQTDNGYYNFLNTLIQTLTLSRLFVDGSFEVKQKILRSLTSNFEVGKGTLSISLPAPFESIKNLFLFKKLPKLNRTLTLLIPIYKETYELYLRQLPLAA